VSFIEFSMCYRGPTPSLHPQACQRPSLPSLFLGVNLWDRLCGVPRYASAQSLDFLDLGQKSSFLNWKRHKVPIFKKTINGWALIICRCFEKMLAI